jgi:WD40 repeat protein
VKVDVEGAKKASDDATKAADEAAKALAEDKPFTEQVTKLKAGPAAEANAARDAAAKAVADLTAKLGEANKTKDAATQALAAAKANLKELSSKQGRTVNGFKSTVWSVAFSPDGKLLAAGSHKALQVWDLSQPKELFPREEKQEETSE